jgi:photosystem II stability/assembly factor-like uncharacterized protein
MMHKREYKLLLGLGIAVICVLVGGWWACWGNANAVKAKHGSVSALRSSAPYANLDQLVQRLEPHPVKPPRIFSDGCFIDERHAWAYGPGCLRRTTNGGHSWEEMRPPQGEKYTWSTSAYLRPSFLTPMRGWVSVSSATWQTNDGGLTWTKTLPYPSAGPYFAGTLSGWLIALVDEMKEINYRTEDGGVTWKSCGPVRDREPSLSRAFFLNPQVGWTIASETDDGQRIEGIAKTTDSGCTWKQMWTSAQHADERYGEIYFLSELEGWLAGTASGSLRHTTDGGATWEDLHPPVKHVGVAHVFFEAPSTGWICTVYGSAAQSGIYRTTDAGLSWNHLTEDQIIEGFDDKLHVEIPRGWSAGRMTRLLFISQSRQLSSTNGATS